MMFHLVGLVAMGLPNLLPGRLHVNDLDVLEELVDDVSEPSVDLAETANVEWREVGEETGGDDLRGKTGDAVGVG